MPEQDLLQLTAGVASAYLRNNQTPTAAVPALLSSIHGALQGLRADAMGEPHGEPAVSIKKSVTDDFIICLEDGEKLRTLKRYLRTHFDLTPDEYRRKWGLPFDYPMVAPSYRRLRSKFAKDRGLGRKDGPRSKPPGAPPKALKKSK